MGGSCYNNFPAIGAELGQKGIYHVVNKSCELADFLSHSERIDFEKIKREAAAAVAARRGSIACILTEIQPLLK